MEMYVTDEWRIYEYRRIMNTHFPAKYEARVNIRTNGEAISEEENQLKQIIFDEQLQRCEDCEQKWYQAETLDSWFQEYRAYIDRGACDLMPEGIDPFLKTIPREPYLLCF